MSRLNSFHIGFSDFFLVKIVGSIATISFWSMFKDLAMATVKVTNHPYAINEPFQSFCQ